MELLNLKFSPDDEPNERAGVLSFLAASRASSELPHNRCDVFQHLGREPTEISFDTREKWLRWRWRRQERFDARTQCSADLQQGRDLGHGAALLDSLHSLHTGSRVLGELLLRQACHSSS
jgi:hypothetical protein